MHTKTEQKDVIESIKTEQMVPIINVKTRRSLTSSNGPIVRKRDNSVFPYIYKRKKRSLRSKSEQANSNRNKRSRGWKAEQYGIPFCIKTEQTFQFFKNGTI